jgi:predicted dehydrogenase
MSDLKIWLVGAGIMAKDYAFVLKALNKPFEVIGRGESSASLFEQDTGHMVKRGGIESSLKNNSSPHTAIVSVGVEQLLNVTRSLIQSGTKCILLEKPGALNYREINSLNLLAKEKKANVLIGYNRRFFQSVKYMKQLILEDGGVLSINYEFTEWSDKIKYTKADTKVKKYWLIANSSHVIDLAFHLCGRPKDWKCWSADSLDWHPSSARFCGSGITDQGIMFSYFSNWKAPGRWSLELMTSKRRFILRPMEELQIIETGNVLIKTVHLENQFDKDFKPGLYLQTKSFLNKDYSLLCSLSEQVKNIKIYSKMAGY